MKRNYLVLGSVITAGLLVAIPVFAQTLTAGGGASARIVQLIAKAQQRADQEVTRRITALTGLSTRANAMVKISADQKSSLSSSIASEITAMNDLQTKINSDAAAQSTSSLKADIQSITVSYRIYMLIIPQGSIEAASDRVLTIAGLMADLGTKLQTRITAAQTAGNDTTAAASSMADFNAKLSDANVQANAAVSEIAGLMPDNGNQTTEASNVATLKDARSKVQAGQKDLTAARADAQAIIKDFAAWKVSVTASSTASTSTP